MDTKELIKRVRKIELKTRGLSNQIFSGEYHSAFKGSGMAFSEVREYIAGDEIRKIDWNVTARLNSPYVKVFDEERELTVMLLVDMSGSEDFGTKKQTKRELITEICAVLAFSAIQNNDKIGAIFFSDKIEKFIPPKKGRSHVLRIIRELLEFKPISTRTNISVALEFLSGILKKRAIVFLLSDFMDTNYEKTLQIASKKHDLTGIRVYDALEEDLPNIGIVPMRDAETGGIQWVDTQSKKLRQNYIKHYLEQVKYFETLFKKNGAGTLSCRIDESYVKKLLSYFKARL